MSPDKKIKTSLAVFITVFLAFFVFLIYPLFNGIQQAGTSFVVQKNTLAELEAKIENLKNFQATYESYQSNFSKVENLFIDPKEPVGFIEFLEEESADSQVFIDITPLATNTLKEDVWPSMNFQLTLIGSFPRFLSFFEKLESSPYLFKVLSLNVRRLTESEIKAKEFDSLSAQDISAILSIKVYTK